MVKSNITWSSQQCTYNTSSCFKKRAKFVFLVGWFYHEKANIIAHTFYNRQGYVALPTKTQKTQHVLHFIVLLLPWFNIVYVNTCISILSSTWGLLNHFDCTCRMMKNQPEMSWREIIDYCQEKQVKITVLICCRSWLTLVGNLAFNLQTYQKSFKTIAITLPVFW